MSYYQKPKIKQIRRQLPTCRVCNLWPIITLCLQSHQSQAKKSKSLWMWVMYSNLSALQRKCPFWLNFFRLLNASLALRSFFAYKIQRANTWIPPKLKETCSSKRQGLYFFWMSINYMMNKYIKDSIVLLLTAQYWERAASTWNLDGNSQ